MLEILFQYYNKGVLAFSAATGIYGLSTDETGSMAVGSITLLLGLASVLFASWRDYYDKEEKKIRRDIAEYEFKKLQDKK
jgi:hypothetical protein